MSLDKTLRYGLLLLLLLAPLPFGAVEPWAAAALAAGCFLLGAIGFAGNVRRGRPLLPWRHPIVIAGGLVLLLGLTQMVPVPRRALEMASPRAAEIRLVYEPPSDAGEEGPDGWRPLSLAPWSTRRSLVQFAAYLLAALAAMRISGRPGGRLLLAAGIAAAGALQALYGLIETFSGHYGILGYAKKFEPDLVSGTFINKNHFAGYLEMTIPLAVGLAALAFARLQGGARDRLAARLEGSTARGAFLGSGWLLLALVMATALAYSRSRAGIACALLAFAAVSALLVSRGRARGFAVAVLVLIGASWLLVGQAEIETGLLRRFLLVGESFRGEIGRGAIWRQAAAMTADFPLFGVGLGAYGQVFPAFRTTGGAGFAVGHAHNEYLEWFAETGLAGAGVLLVAAWLLARAVKGRGRPRGDDRYLEPAFLIGIVAIAFHSLVDFNLAIPANALTFAVLVGAWLGGRRGPVAVEPAPGSRWRPAVGPVGVCLLLALSAAAGVLDPPRFLAAREGGREPGPIAGPAEGTGDSWLAWFDPGNPERRFRAAGAIARASLRDLEVLLEARLAGNEPSETAVRWVEGRLERAAALQEDGLRLLPTSANGHLVLGHLRFSRCIVSDLEGPGAGCGRVAIPEIRAALDLNPMGAALHLGAARFLLSAGPLLPAADRARFLPDLQRAVEMNPEETDLRVALDRFLQEPAPSLD